MVGLLWISEYMYIPMHNLLTLKLYVKTLFYVRFSYFSLHHVQKWLQYVYRYDNSAVYKNAVIIIHLLEAHVNPNLIVGRHAI